MNVTDHPFEGQWHVVLPLPCMLQRVQSPGCGNGCAFSTSIPLQNKEHRLGWICLTGQMSSPFPGRQSKGTLLCKCWDGGVAPKSSPDQYKSGWLTISWHVWLRRPECIHAFIQTECAAALSQPSKQVLSPIDTREWVRKPVLLQPIPGFVYSCYLLVFTPPTSRNHHI